MDGLRCKHVRNYTMYGLLVLTLRELAMEAQAGEEIWKGPSSVFV